MPDRNFQKLIDIAEKSQNEGKITTDTLLLIEALAYLTDAIHGVTTTLQIKTR